MGINVRCPECGGSDIQVLGESDKPGCFRLIIFEIPYFAFMMVRWCIGLCVLIFWDLCISIVCKIRGKGYVWRSKKWFSNRRKVYFCHNCGHTFRA